MTEAPKNLNRRALRASLGSRVVRRASTKTRTHNGKCRPSVKAQLHKLIYKQGGGN